MNDAKPMNASELASLRARVERSIAMDLDCSDWDWILVVDRLLATVDSARLSAIKEARDVVGSADSFGDAAWSLNKLVRDVEIRSLHEKGARCSSTP